MGTHGHGGISAADRFFKLGMAVPVKLQLWDLADETRFRFLLADYCRGASGAIVCFDVTNFDTFWQVPAWIDMIREESKAIPIMLVGTNSDRPSQQVPHEFADRYARDAGCIDASYLSMDTSFNVETTFQCIATWMVWEATTARGG